MNLHRFGLYSLFLIFSLNCRESQVQQDLAAEYEPKIGDIYFQSLPLSALVATIEGATNSRYSHCGILDKVEGEWVIYEAIGPVKATDKQEWIDQGQGGQYDVFRLRTDYQSRIPELLDEVKTYMGLPYDIQYDFDDEKIYCSELLFKSFRSVFNEDLGEVVKLGDLNWEPFEGVIIEIDPTLPLEREMITPRHLSEADQIEVVFESIDKSQGPSKF